MMKMHLLTCCMLVALCFDSKLVFYLTHLMIFVVVKWAPFFNNNVN